MDGVLTLLRDLIENETFIQAVLSNRRKKKDLCTKVSIRPVQIGDSLRYQAERHHRDKVFHDNLEADALPGFFETLLREQFRQATVFAADADYTILANKPDRVRIVKSPATKQALHRSHNRPKQHIFPEGTPCPVLEQLGVMTASGKVVARHRDKFKQINRFLEIVTDVLPSLPKNPHIVDFGCGKSYLTFALYHYLNVQLGYEAKMVGLDLKEEVIDWCNEQAHALGYGDLMFRVGDIADDPGSERADMVVTLHACDTATDAALERAADWNARVILSVPCCQHELFDQVEQPAQRALLSHGLLKERFSSLLTDGLRALALEYRGYDVSIIEFVDLEHTAKNLMLRGVRKSVSAQRAGEIRREFEALCAYWNVSPSIRALFSDSNEGG